jgi:hypothetical protein
MLSVAQPVGQIRAMPAFAQRSLYMHRVGLDTLQLPEGFADYVPVLEQMLTQVSARNAVGYVTIDEKRIINTTHRRGGKHVDYNWYETPGMHVAQGSHIATPCPTPGGSHRPAPAGQHRMPRNWAQTGGYWKPGLEPGGMLLVSNVAGCQVYEGEYDGEFGPGGCCAAISTDHLATHVMPANEVYFLNSLGIHESLPIAGPVERTLIRLNFHPDYQFSPS